ncbi:RdgB/HAM1 family non-canonical purine NTP pyrophosphatase [Novosphingopyxis sp.]|uniref:RdgB/HAM1 family non-canonical purine NTP pyrophosphatase n=1 Tax=Novosphingopyxis sp. TaxID=2709690 RepID=UPI003B5A4AD4
MPRKLTPGELIIATHNDGKLHEITALLGPYGVTPVSAGQLGLSEPAEIGTTFAENALIKARAAVAATGRVALADDSGLGVAALDGAPGVYTADWAEKRSFEGGPGRDWYMAMGKVEGKLAELGADVDRSARFFSTLALVWPDGHHGLFEGSVSGSLVWPPRGQKGFGYDPVFMIDGDTRTFAEMDPAQKQKIDHRADAFAKLVAAVF